jgi:predicted O-methyltransferase YrrM
MNQVRAYFAYLKASKTRHGVHSPFVFSFIENCLSAKMDKKSKTRLKHYLKTLQNNKSRIVINDFGAGSKKLGSIRKVNRIARISGSRGKYGRLLYNLCHYFKVKSILELGTSVGIGTVTLKLGSSDAIISTIEACENTQKVAIEAWGKNLINIEKPILSTFIDYLQNDHIYYDLIYIDGHHDGGALINYINLLQKNCTNETIIVVDDIHWSKSMQMAWNALIKDVRFNVSLEFFRMGILIQRKEQRKEHFILRY